MDSGDAGTIQDSKMQNVTGKISAFALANLIHASPALSSVSYHSTLENIRDCIACGDEWFVEDLGNEFRVSTDSGFSARVANRSFIRLGTNA